MHALLVGDGSGDPSLAAELGEWGATQVHVAGHPALGGFAPDAIARIVDDLAATLDADVVVGAGTEAGNTVMARAAARAGLPFAANCTAVIPGSPMTVTRLRWGGSLLEEAAIHAGRAMLTVAPHAVTATPAPTGGTAAVEVLHPAARRRRSRRAGGGPRAGGSRRRLAGRRPGRRDRRPRGRIGGGLRARSSSWPACSVRPSAARAPSPSRAGARTRSRWARRGRRSPPTCTSPRASAARPSTWPAARAPGGSWRSTRTPRRRSCRPPTTPSSGTCTRCSRHQRGDPPEAWGLTVPRRRGA